MKAEPKSEEYQAFKNLLGNVLSVPKKEIDRRIAEDKRAKIETKVSSPASVVPAKPV